MNLRLAKSLSVLSASLCGGGLLGGCNALETPQQACVAPSTIDGVSQRLIEGLGENLLALATLQRANLDLASLPQLLQGLRERGSVSIDDITLKSVDKDTKVVRCAGTLQINFKSQVKATKNSSDGGAVMGSESGIVYERQPQANGTGYVYRVVSVEDYQLPLAMLLASTKAPSAAASPTAASAPAPAQSNGDKVEAEAVDTQVAGIPYGNPTHVSFDGYPATPFSGTAVMPDYTGDQKDYAEYRSRLDEAAKGGVNFAGELALAQWGCGTECSAVTAIDLRTGKLYNFPLGGEDNLSLDLKFQATSNLVAATWQSGDDSKSHHYCVSQSFLWTGSGFQNISSSKQDGDCPAG